MSFFGTESRGLVAMFLTLFGFWLLVSGQIDPQHLIAGSLSALLVTLYWRSLLRRARDRDDVLPYRLLSCAYTPVYVLYLMVQIVKANINVARIVLSPSLPISPVMTRTRTVLRHDLLRVLFAHSITLTPGSLALGLSGDRVVVHSLTAECGDLKQLAALESRLRRIERRLG